MPTDNILERIAGYYSRKIKAFGPTSMGVDWNSPESQRMRFEQLIKVIDGKGPFTINDYGCGYGALFDYLLNGAIHFQYYGFDVSKPMVEEAIALHKRQHNCAFYHQESALTTADYTVASGVFNVRLDIALDQWKGYVLDTLDKINGLSQKGFSFNVLTSYSDKEKMRPDLYYVDPRELFDICKRKYSSRVALLHDYPLYEFTLIVRK